ncbi:hypothetical protein CERSUDRAFT_101429 [Gelatoporia subvermispora B]|uniref:Uncharacterized protein n=1 Tax=Ceriporiopsis subvermispora (strain B) TaxID=914234 RepID=M2QV52_CERS8|nr:hypothetical protein CERSUDRAFT_101429 [Gelatoporia subvermispora B]
MSIAPVHMSSLCVLAYGDSTWDAATREMHHSHATLYNGGLKRYSTPTQLADQWHGKKLGSSHSPSFNNLMPIGWIEQPTSPLRWAQCWAVDHEGVYSHEQGRREAITGCFVRRRSRA